MVAVKNKWKGDYVLKKILLMSLTTLLNMSFATKRLPESLRYKTLEDIQKEGQTVQKKQDGKVRRVSVKSKFNPIFSKSNEKISTFEKIPGCLFGNIISSGAGTKVTIETCGDSNFPEGSYFACFGQNLIQKYDNRVLLNCSKLITPHREYDVDASVVDYYGVDGIKADKVFDGTEEGVITAGVTSLFQSVIESFKTTESTLNGTQDKKSVGNMYAGGIQDGAASANSEARRRGATNKHILVVSKGKKILIQFNREFFYEL